MTVDKAVEHGCGDKAHASWRVVRDGFYGRPPRRRQRYLCYNPANPTEERHKFTPQVVRLEAARAHCLECENDLTPGQGPNAGRHYDFAAREIAAALVAVANGSTYAQAGLTARHTVRALTEPFDHGDWPVARRAHPGQAGNERSNHGTLVATWVEAFTDVVLGGPEVVEMPRVLLLDSTSFYRIYAHGRGPAFAVLAAYGYPTWPGPGRLLRAVTYRTASGPTWADFLSQMPGMPEVVVSDGGQEVINGIDLRWPMEGVGNRPERVRCRWHLAKNLREALVKDIKPHAKAVGLKDPKSHPLWERAERAFDSLDAYQTYYGWAYRSLLSWTPDDLALPAALRWLNRNDLLIRAQLLRHADGRPGPGSTGPLEAEMRQIRRYFAHRAQGLRNAPRTNLLLRLLVAARNGQADERTWAERIRRHLAENGGLGPKQRQLVGAGGL